jgi:selenocysteine lyase/cysteine desulfurase
VSIPIADAADKLRAAGIRASVRAGALRVGFHLYNTENDLDQLLDALR